MEPYIKINNNNNNQKGMVNRKYYTIEKNKTNKNLINKKVELKLKESIHLSEIIDEFKNVNNISINTFKEKYIIYYRWYSNK